ncbi:uncharacterized protein LOC141640741 [Silene latifolia]|uniref:uncharacterized protein LOC141640741 n=1 Tax=Silene latifolia TaxID=37657 RepID=UPI003D782B70
MRSPLVAWQQVCLPKTEGGLGIRYSQTWNIATVGKLVWWVYSKPDNLWVKWIHQVYMKGCDWDSYSPKSHMSGNWKAICKVRDIFQPGYLSGNWLANGGGYNVSSGYEWFETRGAKVGWAKSLWHKWSLAKHSFHCWLIFKNALNVKDKLFRHGVSTDAICCICNTTQETVVHLMQHCQYGQLILTGVCLRLQIPVPVGNALIWIGRRRWSDIQKKTSLCAVMAVYYHIWQQRNNARLNATLCNPRVVIEQIMSLVQLRVQQFALSMM